MPYIPDGREIIYLEHNEYLEMAKDFALKNSKDDSLKNASVIVRDGVVLGIGANGSDYHKFNECMRRKLNIPTGEGYELCEGCHPKNHGEPQAIKNAIENGNNLAGADLYLWGHWWCCEPCWNEMIAAGIKNVYLLKDSHVFFNREDPNNILGK